MKKHTDIIITVIITAAIAMCILGLGATIGSKHPLIQLKQEEISLIISLINIIIIMLKFGWNSPLNIYFVRS